MGGLLLWLVILAGMPVLPMGLPRTPVTADRTIAVFDRLPLPDRSADARPPSAPPSVDPPHIYALDADRARALNAAIAFADRANPPARPFHFTGGAGDLARATDCLASAQFYEAGDDVVGEQAVAQVVLNRVRHPAFPKTICGVVFQGQERRTGCQFTFTCDGALARTPSPVAWARARGIAKAAIGGAVFRQVGLATHYHTDWVVPYWSASLDKTTKVGTHLFFRWAGWWGTPSAFQQAANGVEPMIGRIARLSLAHRDAVPDAAPAMASAQSAADTVVETGVPAAPAPGKSWTPAPTLALPVGVRRSAPVEMVDNDVKHDAKRERAIIALGPEPPARRAAP